MSIVRAVSCLKSTHMPSMAARYASAAAAPGKSKVQLQKPQGESGFFSYDRNISRDPKLKGVPKPHPGDTLASFLFRRLGHAYEIYPLFFLGGFLAVICCATIYYSFDKIEVWVDRSEVFS
ncbi:unnamed protein product [Angiostrongylus costaricensis]|uniref:NADH dehydrogenase [ubiquinone] 1 beta subcomplex subunit 8, mitochondrial n=1 Tax=Angiostrongylus costaricensis TaxID=334426 RepID=A0A0R3PIZ0_ANGCS|nr:unnamed protein product [Angiostrongylus costaricensis]